MQWVDGKCSPNTDKASRRRESKSKVSVSCRILEILPSHSEAETVIIFAWAVKADSFTQGVLKKKCEREIKLNFNIRSISIIKGIVHFEINC